jgi:hypothetical protein
VSPILSARGGLSSRAYGQFAASTAAPDTGAMFPLGMVQVGSGGSATISFTSIPATYKHLQLRGIGRDDLGNSVNMTFNSDTGTNYARHRLIGNGTAASATGTISLANIPLLANAGLPTAANTFGVFVIDILDYTNTNKYTTARVLSGKDINASGGVDFTSGLWLNTNAISTITLTAASSAIFQQYSQFALYGIKGA